MSCEGQPLPAPAPVFAPVPGEAARAVVRTVSYAALFQAPLALERLHRALMDVRLDPDGVTEALRDPWVRARIEVTAGRAHPRGRAGWVDLSEQRRQHTARLLRGHRKALGALARFPFVRLVGLSGGCAHENATDQDVDVFIVARRGRAWCVYLGLVLLSRLLGVRRTLCINYVVDEDALALPERDLFTASELVGLRPLAGGEAYRAFVRANAWVAGAFPNFFDDHARGLQALPPAGAARWLERLLDGTVAPALERLSRALLGARLRRKAGGAGGMALDPSRLKLHLHDHRPRLLAEWEETLRAEEAEGGPELPDANTVAVP